MDTKPGDTPAARPGVGEWAFDFVLPVLAALAAGYMLFWVGDRRMPWMALWAALLVGNPFRVVAFLRRVRRKSG